MQQRNGISMIIPIYNVEAYIGECLKSVVESMDNLPDIQVILVDDGSQDGSGAIAREYAEAHSNFLYLLKENGGLSDARNFGLNYAEYSYIAFLDSDDSIQKSFFPKVFEALKTLPDLVIFDWLDVEESKSQVVKGMDFEDVLWSVQPSACNKVFKASLFEEVRFPVGQVFEDVGTIYKLLHEIGDYVYIKECLYLYRKNRGGSILSTVSPSINDIYGALEETYRFYLAKGALTGGNRTGLCYQYVKLLSWSNMYRQLQFFKYDFWGFYRKMKDTRELLYARFPEWQHNEYLKRNRLFFKERLGDGYINKLDQIGKSPLKTFQILIFLVLKNRKRAA